MKIRKGTIQFLVLTTFFFFLMGSFGYTVKLIRGDMDRGAEDYLYFAFNYIGCAVLVLSSYFLKVIYERTVLYFGSEPAYDFEIDLEEDKMADKR